MDIHDKKLTQDQVDKLMSPMELDLIAFFKQLQEDILGIIDKPGSDSPDQLIADITALLEG